MSFTSWPCSRRARPRKCAPAHASRPISVVCRFAVKVISCLWVNFFFSSTLPLSPSATRGKVVLPRSIPTERICISIILLEPAHKILHTTVKFKRRTISVTPFSRNCGRGNEPLSHWLPISRREYERNLEQDRFAKSAEIVEKDGLGCRRPDNEPQVLAIR